MDGKSVDVAQQKLEQLKQILPEAFSEGKLDLEKLRLAIGEDIAIQNERYVLNWAGKGDAFRALQTPTTATLAPAREESVNFDETENIFIEGENLEVLKVLQKAYYGKVKMIYIDPPYNTGSDSFVYPDKFSESREDYLKRIEAKDEEGFVLKEGQFRENSKDSGHYHSNWLSMMYPRLFLARNLLREDGVIFVSIDDNEVHNLRLLMNDIFGEENFVGTIVRGTGQTTGQDSNKLGSSFDYVLVFSRTEEFTVGGIPLSEKDIARFSEEDETGKYAYWQMRKTGSNDRREDRPNMFFPVKAPDGSEVFPIGPGGYDSRWRFERKTYKKMVADNMILWKQVNRNGEQTWWPYVKYYLEGRTKKTFTFVG
jgi:adenine-specific DNA-methyltransferase